MKININGLVDYFRQNVLFVILVPIVIVSQLYILAPHLKYGFGDVDWGFLSFYKTQNPYSINQFIKNIEIGGTMGGVYTHQIYYIGILSELFGLNFMSFQVVTHIFRTLAIIAMFPLFLVLSKSKLIAFISTILFAFSYSAVGTMYTVVTSSDYSAIFMMGIFVIVYWYIVVKKISNIFFLLFLLFLLILTLFLSTERMYQLPLFIALTELFMFWQSKKLDKVVIKRLTMMFVPLVLIFLAKPMVFLSYFLSHIEEIVKGVSAGDWNLFLTPIIALGSIVIPHDYTKFLGTAKIDNFQAYFDFLIQGPLPIFVIITVLICSMIFKRAHILINQTLCLIIIYSVLLYLLASNYTNHQISKESIVQAFVGFYIMTIALVSFGYWLKNRNRQMIGLFVGPFFAFIYIILTWMGAATAEVFSGIHRYLTIPALFIDLFLASLVVLMFTNLYILLKKFGLIKYAAFIVFIPMLFFINLNILQIKFFFEDQLRNGFGAEDKNLMRSQLNNEIKDLDNKEQSLFYFDFLEDQDKGYYYDNALLAGFQSWMLWHPSINFKTNLAPKAFWNSPEMLKKIIKNNGEEVILYKDNTYKVSNFYAFKIKDKKLFNNKDEVLRIITIAD